jgi:hypothetical protein
MPLKQQSIMSYVIWFDHFDIQLIRMVNAPWLLHGHCFLFAKDQTMKRLKEIWHWGLKNNWIVFVWCTINFWCCMKFVCCARLLPILASMLSKEDMYFREQLTLCFKFYVGMMVYLTMQNVCPLLLYCEDNMANDVVLLPKRNQCFMYFFPFLHR